MKLSVARRFRFFVPAALRPMTKGALRFVPSVFKYQEELNFWQSLCKMDSLTMRTMRERCWLWRQLPSRQNRCRFRLRASRQPLLGKASKRANWHRFTFRSL
jgi:hypothetical protein